MYMSTFMSVPYSFDYCSFVVSLKSQHLIPPALFFFLKIALAISRLLKDIFCYIHEAILEST